MGSIVFRRLEWIKNSGIWVDYRWDTSLPDLARINVIYGPNGVGKTSLSRALDATRSIPNGFQHLSIQVEESGAERSTNGQDDAVFDRLYVFGEAYVERSHRFHEGSPNIDAVLTLGERTAEAEEQLATLREEMKTRTSELDQAKRDVHAAERAATSAQERVSAAVVGDLSRVDGYRSRGSYNSRRVRDKFAGDRGSWKTLSDAALASKKQFVASDNREALDSDPFSLTPDSTLETRADKLLSATPVTIVLDTLRSNPGASTWVQEGQTLHEHSDVCIFCGQKIPAGRLQDIEQHFSHEIARLQRDLDSLNTTLESLDSDADAIVRRIPNRSLLFDDLRTDFDAAAQSLRDQSTALKSWANELRARVRAKRANVLEAVDAEATEAPAINGSSLETVLKQQNDRVAQHATLLAAAAVEIEGHHLKSEEAEIDKQVGARANALARQTTAQKRIDAINDEIAKLESVEGDPTPSAEVLTREVSRLLGRNELTFQARDGKYVVTRDGQPAIGLSVGERTAITLIHFLEGVAHHDRKSKGNPIVVIDDPVSSLDSNIFMGISTYLWTVATSDDTDKLVDQFILLTHNFELFKQWDVQLESLHRGAGMKKKYPAELYELKSRHITSGGRTRRQPVIVKWPESGAVRKKIRSSYHHAFISVVDAKKKLAESDSLENRLDAQLLFPNVIRRILESFLAFKRPDWLGDFTASMRKAGQLLIDSGYGGDADALRQQLTRYAHAYSHSQTPETDDTVSPDEIDAALSAVFVFMDQLDHEHFVGLCTVVGADPVTLLPESAAGDDPAAAAEAPTHDESDS
jgi:wobble nucleotide-excising tRNase